MTRSHQRIFKNCSLWKFIVAGEHFLATGFFFLFRNQVIVITHTCMPTCLLKYTYCYIANLEFHFQQLSVISVFNYSLNLPCFLNSVFTLCCLLSEELIAATNATFLEFEWSVNHFITHKRFQSADGHMLLCDMSNQVKLTHFSSTSLKDLFRLRNADLYQRTLSHQSRIFCCHEVRLVGDLTPGYGLEQPFPSPFSQV